MTSSATQWEIISLFGVSLIILANILDLFLPVTWRMICNTGEPRKNRGCLCCNEYSKVSNSSPEYSKSGNACCAGCYIGSRHKIVFFMVYLLGWALFGISVGQNLQLTTANTIQRMLQGLLTAAIILILVAIPVSVAVGAYIYLRFANTKMKCMHITGTVIPVIIYIFSWIILLLLVSYMTTGTYYILTIVGLMAPAFELICFFTSEVYDPICVQYLNIILRIPLAVGYVCIAVASSNTI